MSDEWEYTRKLLEIEYGQVRGRLATLDDIRFKLKGWAVTLSTAFLALGFSKGQRWVMLLSLLAAALLFLVEADYLLRQESLQRRSDKLEQVMECLRRDPRSDEVETYVFGLRAVSRQGVTGRRFPQMFGSRSRAGFAYLFIAITTVAGMLVTR